MGMSTSKKQCDRTHNEGKQFQVLKSFLQKITEKIQNLISGLSKNK